MMKTPRAAEIAVFCAFVIFSIGYLAFLRFPDPLATYNPVVRVHPEIAALFEIVLYAGFIALLAILVGGVPIVFVTFRHAIAARRRDVLVPLAIAALIAVVFVIYSAIVYAITNNRPGTGIRPLRPVDVVLSLIWLVLFTLGLIAGTVAVSLAVARSNLGERIWRLALIPAALATAAMVVALLATIIERVIVQAEAPQLSASQDVNFGILAVIIAFMAAASVLAAIALIRGLKARASYT